LDLRIRNRHSNNKLNQTGKDSSLWISDGDPQPLSFVDERGTHGVDDRFGFLIIFWVGKGHGLADLVLAFLRKKPAVKTHNSHTLLFLALCGFF